MATKKSKSILQSKMAFSTSTLVIVALLCGLGLGYAIRAYTHAAAAYAIDVAFTAVDGTWPTAVLDDPMSVALGRYNSDYGFAGEKAYGPVLHLTGTASGLKTNLNADTSVMCGQTEPVPQYQYDSSSKQWGITSTGNELMSLTYHRLTNGANDFGLNIYGAQSAKIDRTKPMICWAQIYVTQKQGTKLTTAVPVTQKFVLQPK
jgi:hypothetical protein